MTQKYVVTSAKSFYTACDPINALQCSQWVSNGADLPTWWKMRLADPTVLTGYRFTGSDYSTGRSPKDFTLSGSNDDSSWTTLDTRTGISWSISEAKTFTFSNTTAYLYYRIDVTATNNGDYTTIWFLEFIPLVLVSASAKTTLDVEGALRALRNGMFTTASDPALWHWVSNGGDLPTWHKTRFGTPLICTSYAFTGSDYRGQRSPKNFTLSGSNDDSSWTTLDTRTGISWSISERKTFTFSNSTAYAYYRIDVTATDDGTYTTIGNLLFDPSFPQITGPGIPFVRRPLPLRAARTMPVQRSHR